MTILFILSLTVHEKRDRFCELEFRTRVQSDEFLVFQLKSYAHDFPVRTTDAQDF